MTDKEKLVEIIEEIECAYCNVGIESCFSLVRSICLRTWEKTSQAIIDAGFRDTTPMGIGIRHDKSE